MEEFFQILYHYKGAISYTDLWDVSINERKWFIERLNRQLKDEEDMAKKMSKK